MKLWIALFLFASSAFAAENTSTVRMTSPTKSSSGWIAAGLGSSTVIVDQTIDSFANISQTTQSSFSQSLNLGFLSDENWGLAASYNRIPNQNLNLADSESMRFHWSEMGVEVLGRMPTDISMLGTSTSFGAAVGLVRRDTTLLAIDSTAKLGAHDVSTIGATARGSVHLDSGRWHHLFHLGSEMPIASNGYNLKGQFVLSGGLGTSLDFARKFTAGLFATSKAFQGTYTYNNDGIVSKGRQSVVATSLDFRLGMQF